MPAATSSSLNHLMSGALVAMDALIIHIEDSSNEYAVPTEGLLSLKCSDKFKYFNTNAVPSSVLRRTCCN
jgi:hypothetical protein